MEQDRRPKPNPLAARLRQERERHGLTQEFVARELGIPRQAVSEVENGHRELSALELFRLSKLLAINLAELFRVSDGASIPELRGLRAEGLDDEARGALARFENRSQTYLELEQLLGETRDPEIRSLNDGMFRFEEAHQLARDERRRLDLGGLPAWSLLPTLEDRVRVKVFVSHAGDLLSGACAWNGHGPSILINSHQYEPRKVFTLAHEYFHLLVPHAGGGSEVMAAVCTTSNESKSRADKLADQFASELLMPEESVRNQVDAMTSAGSEPNKTQLVRLAIAFGVSLLAMTYRLLNLKLLSKSPFDVASGSEELRQTDRQERQSCDLPSTRPSRMDMLALSACHEGMISRGRLAEILEVGPADASERLAVFEAFAHGGPAE